MCPELFVNHAAYVSDEHHHGRGSSSGWVEPDVIRITKSVCNVTSKNRTSRALRANSFPHSLVSTSMANERNHNPMLWSTIAIALLVSFMSIAGLFWPAIYARETAYGRAGAYASDLVDLFLVVPILLISGIRGYRGSVPAHLVWLGTQGYLLYNLVIYAFGVHFNALFLVYCATLSLSFYATVFSLPFIPLKEIAATYAARAPRKIIAVVFLLLSIRTVAFDLRDDIRAIMAGRIPQDIIDANQPVNFIHVLDPGFLLPALCITGVLLFRRRVSAYTLAPVFLTLLAIMSMELVSIMAVMGRLVFGISVPMIVFFAALGVGFTALLWLYFSSAQKATLTATANQLGVPSAP